ncbi:MAG: rod shape-determining protein RodA [Spirochaetales bacterium]
MIRNTSLRFDFSLLIASLLLVLIGILFIYSSGVTSTGVVYSSEYIKQSIWAIVGFILLIALSFIDYHRYKEWAFRIYFINLFLLILTLLFGKVVHGSKSWLGIWELGIQPSEFMKVSTILYLAYLIQTYPKLLDSWIGFFLSFIVVLVPIALILLQPDFGTALVFLPIFFFIVFSAGAKLEYVLFLLFTGGLAILFTLLPLYGSLIGTRTPHLLVRLGESDIKLFLLALFGGVTLFSFLGLLITKKQYLFRVGYVGLILSLGIGISFVLRRFLKQYQLMRLLVFLNPSIDPRGAGWNIIQSLTAVGSGGLWGKGFLKGPHSHFRYIPQQSTDFIFSIIAEEWGFVGSALVLILFATILFRGLRIMRVCKDPFVLYAGSGIVGMIFFHLMVNMGMVMGIMPITGIPLFFLSYGGSSLITVLLSIGLLSSFYLHRYKY